MKYELLNYRLKLRALIPNCKNKLKETKLIKENISCYIIDFIKYSRVPGQVKSLAHEGTAGMRPH